MNSKTLCFAIDDRFVWPLIVSMYSCQRNNDEVGLDVVLLNINSSLSSKNQNLIAKVASLFGIKITISQIDSSFKPEFSNKKSIVVYGPLFALDLIEGDFLWLDADTILLPGWTSIFENLGDNFKENNIVRAIHDSELTLKALEKAGSRSFEVNSHRYFNSGVMLLNPRNWRKTFNTTEWQNVAKKHREYRFLFNDQDVLNFLINSEVSLLSKKYNEITGSRSLVSDSKILHFASTPKPWNLSIKAKQLMLGHLGIRHTASHTFSRLVDFELYWMYELEALDFFKKISRDTYDELKLMNKNELQELDTLGSLKHQLMKFFSTNFRY